MYESGRCVCISGRSEKKERWYMDKLAKNFLWSITPILVILLLTVTFYLRLGQRPDILLAGSLAITFYVAADIVLAR